MDALGSRCACPGRRGSTGIMAEGFFGKRQAAAKAVAAADYPDQATASPAPPEQKPPEPVMKEEIKLSEPTPEPMDQADEPPPGPDLGIDAEGTGSGDGFGLVGKKGGADLIGGPKGNPWAWYDAILNDAVNSAFQEALAREKALKDKTYKVVVKVWIDAAGKIARIALVDKTGDPKVDELLKDVLENLRALREGPPADMPQPVKIRVTSRA